MDLLAVAQRTLFAFKIASTLSLACGGFFLARRAVRPGGADLPLLALLPGVRLLAFRGATDRSGPPQIMGCWLATSTASATGSSSNAERSA
jgi:hypothetical protein